MIQRPIGEEEITPIGDPVVANDGYTYDRKNIEEWWSKSDLSPMTGLPIDSKSLMQIF